MSKTVSIPFNNWIVRYIPKRNKKQPYQGIVNWYTDDLEYNAQESKEFTNHADAVAWCEETMKS